MKKLLLSVLIAAQAFGSGQFPIYGSSSSGGGGGGAAVWGSITGTLSNQTDLQAALDAKQATVSFASVGAVPNAAGASISGGTITLQPASATQPGVLTTGAQSIAGAKTLTAALAGTSAVFSGAVSGLTFNLATNNYFAKSGFHTQAFTESVANSGQYQVRSVDTSAGTGGALMVIDARGFSARYTDEYFFPDNTFVVGSAAIGTPRTSSFLYRPKTIYIGTSISGGDEDTADANAASSLTVGPQNKIAGTGAGGALNLVGGTSSGGTAGAVSIKTANTERFTIASDGKIKVSQATADTGPATTVAAKMPVYNIAGTLLGYIAIFDDF